MLKRSHILVGILFLCALTASAGAADVLAQFDCSTIGGSWWQDPFYVNYQIMETFTTTAAGTVDSVDVTVHKIDGSTTAKVTAKIFAVQMSQYNGWQPTGEPLSIGSLGATSTEWGKAYNEWKNIPMSHAYLADNTRYGLVLDAEGTDWDYSWYTKSTGTTDLFPDGTYSIKNSVLEFGPQVNYDDPFRINTPEPATMAMLLSLGGAWMLRRRVVA